MRIKKTDTNFGLMARSLHWLIAGLTVTLFVLGIWMVDLGYYDAWYHRAPWWHKGLGAIVTMLVLFRFVWQYLSPSPRALASIPRWQQLAAHSVHILMNMLIILLAITGYLVVTAKGQELNLFDLIRIPATITGITNLEDDAGKLHLLVAWLLIGLAVLHLLAALKHHFVDKDATLKRMLGRN